MKIEIKNRFDAVIFEHDVEGNTIALTVEAAVKNGATLNGANLISANLDGVRGNKKELRSLQLDAFNVAFTNSVLQIGCKRFTHQEWREFDDYKISKMDNGALEWWKNGRILYLWRLS